MFLAIDAASLIWFCALFKDESKNFVSSGHGSQLKSQKKEEDYSVDVNSEYTSSPAEFTAMSKFGWSLQDIVHDPSRTGLTNFRNKFRPRRRPPQPLPLSASSQLFHDDHEEVVGSNNELHYWNSEENLMLEMSNSAADLSRLKRQTSLSQGSDTSSSRRIHSSMSDSGYPSLTSTGSNKSLQKNSNLLHRFLFFFFYFIKLKFLTNRLRIIMRRRLQALVYLVTFRLSGREERRWTAAVVWRP